MQNINPYLTFDGDCRAAFETYAKVLGAHIDVIMSHGESPMADQVSPEWRDKVIHAQLTFGTSILMGSDNPPGEAEKAQGISVTVNVDEPTEAERIFKALSQGGNARTPMQETFWAHRFGMLVDRFGIPWMVNCAKPM